MQPGIDFLIPGRAHQSFWAIIKSTYAGSSTTYEREHLRRLRAKCVLVASHVEIPYLKMMKFKAGSTGLELLCLPMQPSYPARAALLLPAA